MSKNKEYNSTVEVPSKKSHETFKLLSEALYAKNCYTIITPVDNTADSTYNGFILPLPHQLAYAAGYDWSTEPIYAPIQDAIEGAAGIARQARDSSTNLFDRVKAAVQLTKKTIKSISPDELLDTAATYGGMRIAQMLSGYATGGQGGQKLFYKEYDNTTINPNKILFFNGVEQRQFTVSFDIVPSSRQHAKQCASAIHELHQLASPDIVDDRLFFSYPARFNLEVHALNTTILSYHRFAITSINTNLSPNGVMSWHDDGQPISYILEISGIESDIPDKKHESIRKFLN